MTKPLKELLLRIAQLPVSDQRWIIQQLPHEQHLKFEQLQGMALLKHAQRFRTVMYRPTAPLAPPPPLPEDGMLLATHAPLYIAIILEQGAYPWKHQFLERFDRDGLIQAALEHHVARIQPLVKQTLFHEWEQHTSFETLLEDNHG